MRREGGVISAEGAGPGAGLVEGSAANRNGAKIINTNEQKGKKVGFIADFL